MNAHEEHERNELLSQLESWLELPMIVLGFVWLALLLIDLTVGLIRFFEILALMIWAVFIIDFALKFSLAPRKRTFLKRNWLTLLSLPVPALRVLRVVAAIRLLQAARVARSMSMVAMIGSVNRGMRALGASMGRRGFGYAVLITLLVTVVGAAGIYALEENFTDYGTALWWTAMIMTTIGADEMPRTAEGRVLSILLAVFGVAIFGYVTATLASFFVGQDAEHSQGEIVGAKDLGALTAEIRALKEELRALKEESRS